MQWLQLGEDDDGLVTRKVPTAVEEWLEAPPTGEPHPPIEPLPTVVPAPLAKKDNAELRSKSPAARWLGAERGSVVEMVAFVENPQPQREPRSLSTSRPSTTESDAQRPSGNPWESFNTGIVAPQPAIGNHRRASSSGRRPRSSSRDTRRVSISLSSQSTIPSARRGHVRPVWVCNSYGDREDVFDHMSDYLAGL